MDPIAVRISLAEQLVLLSRLMRDAEAIALELNEEGLANDLLDIRIFLHQNADELLKLRRRPRPLARSVCPSDGAVKRG